MWNTFSQEIRLPLNQEFHVENATIAKMENTIYVLKWNSAPLLHIMEICAVIMLRMRIFASSFLGKFMNLDLSKIYRLRLRVHDYSVAF